MVWLIENHSHMVALSSEMELVKELACLVLLEI